jgi:hypothetical protein
MRLLFSREERCYVSGKLDGPAKYFYTSGAVETRIYENGVLQGNQKFLKYLKSPIAIT